MLKTILSNKLVLIGIVLLLIGLPIAIWQVQKSQDIRQRASSNITIDFRFNPESGTFDKDSSFSVDLVMDAGSYDVGSITFELVYDQDMVSHTATIPESFIILEETSESGSSILTLINSTASAITGDNIKVATLTFNADAVGQANLILNPDIKATATGIDGYLSLSQRALNGISGLYAIVDGPSGTPTLSPPVVPSGTPTPTPTPTLSPGDTALEASVKMSGIGQASGTIENNPNPGRSTREAEILISDANNATVVSTTGNIIYAPGTQSYSGTINLGQNFNSGSYTVKIRLDNTLFKKIPGIVQLVSDSDNQIPTVTLVSGDLNQNNTMDVQDYNDFLACFRGDPSCDGNLLILADLNDNGNIDILDLNILQRGFAIRDGD